jgi:hypothetical protein
MLNFRYDAALIQTCLITRDLCTEDDFAFRQGKNARNEGVYTYK